MNNLLQDIMVFPEVTGAVVCDHKHGLLASTDLPPEISGKPLAGLCQSLGRLLTKRDTITSMEIRFTDGLLLASPVSRTATLLTFCLPVANVPLVNMTISMLLPNLQMAAAASEKAAVAPPEAKAAAPAPVKAKEASTTPKAVAPASSKPAAPASPIPAAPAPTEAAPPKPAKPAAKPVDIDALLSTGPLARTLVELQAGLAYAIGPVGEMVMRDALGEWAKGGECAEQRLNELVGILCREIDDTELENEFREKVHAFL